MKKSLVSLLQIEGEATDRLDMDSRLGEAHLLTYAIQIGYYDAMVVVVELYKPARAKRELVGGVNVDEESLVAFQRCADRFNRIAYRMPDTQRIVKALIIHNAASCHGRATGNNPYIQEIINKSAMTMLEAVSASHWSVRDSESWHTVYSKVAVGLYEQGANSFNETDYRGLIHTMERIGSKDAAGRRLFIAKWLMSRGRNDEAIEALRPVEASDYVSAPNQIAEARAYLAEILQSAC